MSQFFKTSSISDPLKKHEETVDLKEPTRRALD